ncbi:MAG: hypothetical protein LUH07_07095, partial [Lachnospiraceae bacterium]|nr:hypothetical protein [Lachnospiraceae bacterium]
DGYICDYIHFNILPVLTVIVGDLIDIIVSKSGVLVKGQERFSLVLLLCVLFHSSIGILYLGRLRQRFLLKPHCMIDFSESLYYTHHKLRTHAPKV